MYTLRRRVRFYETDGMRVAYHGNYLNWFEEARVEYLREGGVNLNELMEEDIVFPVVEVHVKYLKSAYYDDVLLINACLRKLEYRENCTTTKGEVSTLDRNIERGSNSWIIELSVLWIPV